VSRVTDLAVLVAYNGDVRSAVHRSSRRHFLHGSLALAGLSVLTACDLRPMASPGATPSSGMARIALVGSDIGADTRFQIVRSLADLGYQERATISLERIGISGNPERAVADLLKRPVDAIVASGASAAQAAKAATSTIPIIMHAVSDPVALGLVASLARPGGNVTGLSKSSGGVARKRLELLRDLIPGARQIGVVWNPLDADTRFELSETAVAASQLNLHLRPVPVHTPADYGAAFQAAASDGRIPCLVLSDPVLSINSTHVGMALDRRVPTMYELRRFVAEEQGLISYGPSAIEQGQRIAYLIDRVLKGSHPADLPVMQPSTFDLTVNLNTAKTLGIAIPQSILAQAEIIQ